MKKTGSRWADAYPSMHHADKDEPRDQVELQGFSTVFDNIAAEPTRCPGFACQKKSDECETFCEFANRDDDAERQNLSRFPERASVVAFLNRPTEPPIQGSKRDCQRYLLSSVPRYRGAHATLVLQILGRRNIL